MDLWQVDKLLLFLIFFIPGFISIRVYELLIATEKTNFSISLLEAIGFSSLNFAFYSWWIILIHTDQFQHNHPFVYYLSIFFIGFISPILWPFLFLWLTRIRFIKKILLSPIKSAWDYYFNKRESSWVIVNLKNGSRIGGVYSSNSFTSTFPVEKQIYLEELWVLDEKGSFVERQDRTDGILILEGEIQSLEFYK